MRKPFSTLLVIIFLFFLYLDTGTVLPEEYKPAVIRVAVIKDADYITLTLEGKYKVLSLYTQELLYEGRNLKRAKAIPTLSGLLIDKMPFKIFAIKIEPSKDASIIINNRRFRGSFDIIRTQDLKLLVVNYVDVESYLYGVLYHEVSPRWPMEALKAQAIVARTFALYQSRVMKNKDYDVTSDVYSQVYGGRTSEKWRTNRAVNFTEGKVLTFEGDIFITYYHASCGGHTEDASLIWKINSKPLKGVECNYCKNAPHYRWRKNIPLSKLKEKLKKSGYDIKEISSIEIDGRDESKRIKNLILKGKDSTLKIAAHKFRLAVGPDIIRSTNFEITLDKEMASFEGFGWGHGAGLCQWGSYFMSKKRFKAEDILKFYYPDSEIKDVSELKKAL